MRTGRLRLRLGLLAVAVAFTGCAAADDAIPGASPDPSAAASPATTPAPSTAPSTTVAPGCASDPAADGRGVHERVDVATVGTGRWYTRYVPASYDGSPTPLVVDLHGYLSGAAGQSAMSALDAVADEAGFVLVTPQGSSELPYWNAIPRADLPDDVGFVEAVIDDAAASLCIDPGRVYVDGFSNGAFLASLVACRLADRVAAVAAVAGLLLPEDCAPSRAVPILSIHGTEDRFVSITGPPNPALADLTWNDQSRAAFDGLPFADVRTTAGGWAAVQGCRPEPARRAVTDHVERIEYGGCTDGSVVELYVVEGAGHTWPASAFAAASAPILGPPTSEIDAREVIWAFFDEHPLPSLDR